MSNELKPCPFCKETPSVGLCGDRVMHDCETLGELIVCTVEAWNTRYEHTCELIMHEGSPACSEYLAEQDYGARFCDQCGAKVVRG